MSLFHYADTVNLWFGTCEVANNSYIRSGNIPAYDIGFRDGLFCASNTIDPTTRQWYHPNGDPLGTIPPDTGAYQKDTDGGVLLYKRGNLAKQTGVYCCNISDSSGNTHIFCVGLYTQTSIQANGTVQPTCIHKASY